MMMMMPRRRPVGMMMMRMVLAVVMVGDKRLPGPGESGDPPGRHGAQPDGGERGRGGGHGVLVAAVRAPFAGAVVAPVAAVFCLLLGVWVWLEGWDWGGAVVGIDVVVGCVVGGDGGGDGGAGWWWFGGVRGGRLRVVDGAGDAGWRLAPVGSHPIGGMGR